MRFLSFAVLAALFVVPIPSANAGVISLLNTGSNSLEDDDFEIIQFSGDNVSVGDRLFGVFRIQAVNETAISDGDATFTAVFAAEVTGVTGAPGAATNIEFSPLQSGGADAATTEFAAFTSSLGVTTTSPTNDSSVIVLFDHPDFGVTDQGALPDLGAAVDTFDETAGATFLAEFGDGGGVFDFSTSGDPGVDVLTNLILQGFSSSNTLNFDVLVDNPGDNVEFGDLFGTGSFSPQIPVQIGADPGQFQIATDADFTLFARVVPEPTSAIAFAGLFGLSFVRRRRRA